MGLVYNSLFMLYSSTSSEEGMWTQFECVHILQEEVGLDDEWKAC